MLLIFYFKLFNLIILLIALIIIPKDIEFKLQLHLVLKIEEKKLSLFPRSYVCKKKLFLDPKLQLEKKIVNYIL